MATSRTVTAEDREVELTHLDKVSYPETGFTKGQVTDYYRRAAPYLLPLLAGRPVTLLDGRQNITHKTMAYVYSLRARPRPTVSMPAHGREVEEAAERKDVGRLVYTPDEALARLEQDGDIFEPVLTIHQELPATVSKTPARRTSAEPTNSEKPLRAYRQKRGSSVTPRPVAGRGRPGENPLFVIQKHAARRLHYDLRLEVEGVLKSWSVPRGPSANPADRRLAVQVEDHPLSYHDFEGVIPKGQYGAGRVTIWDHGSYRNTTDDPDHPTPMARAIENGKVEVFFEGEKIKGGYALIRMRGPRRNKPDWLLIKLKDEYVGSLPADLKEQ